jgi:DNA repair protein RecO (recombination protein O)
MLRMEAQDAYILHSRPYQETSLILEFFTPEYGRVAAVGRGIKRGDRQGRGILQPFIPLLIACSGSRELLTLKTVETKGIDTFSLPPGSLQGQHLISGFYLNELLMRLLHPRDPYPLLFQAYRESLLKLARLDQAQASEEQTILRYFEKTLLKVLGYELQLTLAVDSDKPVEPECFYFFDPERGPSLAMREEEKLQKNERVFKGSSLLSLASETLLDVAALQDAKRLMRLALARHLGDRPLATRRLLLN